MVTAIAHEFEPTVDSDHPEKDKEKEKDKKERPKKLEREDSGGVPSNGPTMSVMDEMKKKLNERKVRKNTKILKNTI